MGLVCSLCIGGAVGRGRARDRGPGRATRGEKGQLTPEVHEPQPDTSTCPRSGTQDVHHGPGLQFLPDDVMAKVKQHLSQLDWDCYLAACSLPLRRDLGRHKCLDLGSGGVTWQERALLSDPLVRKLFVAFSVGRANGMFLQKLQLLPNLESLTLYDCGLDVPTRCMFLSLTSLKFSSCTLDASGCPAISTLRYIYVLDSKVLLSGEGHPFPLVSRDAQSLYSLSLRSCEIVDVAGDGELHIDAPQLANLELANVSFKTRSTTLYFAGAPSLRFASFTDSEGFGRLRMAPQLLDAFRRQILPQLNHLSLLHMPPGYLPLSLPALRSLFVACPGRGSNEGPPCQARQYPREITTLTVCCWNGCSVHQALQGAAKAGLKLRELSLMASRHEGQTCTLRDGALEGLEGTLEELTIETGKVDVGAVLGCLLECVRLTYLRLSHDSLSSRLRSNESPLSIPADFLVVALPTLQTLEIPMPAGYLDLRACPQLHSLHVMDAFDYENRSHECPPLACIIVGLRKVSKLLKMPHEGLWASPKGYRHAHWHGRGSTNRCCLCSSAHAVQLGPSSM